MGNRALEYQWHPTGSWAMIFSKSFLCIPACVVMEESIKNLG